MACGGRDEERGALKDDGLPAAAPPAFDTYASDCILHRAAPFIFAVGVALALIPVQDLPVDLPMLAIAATLVVVIIGIALVVGRIPSIPAWMPRVLPFAYLAAIALLREATGGALSGYGVLLFLAPFWAALYDTRRQVVLLLAAMFVAQVGFAFVQSDFQDLLAVRRGLVSLLVVGMISLAVHRNVAELRAAQALVSEQARQRARLNERLRDSNARLGRSNRELEQFAYVSSHDLQEPLRMIRSFSQLFLQRHGERLDDDGRELLDFVVDGADRAQQLVNDLLEYSRVETTGSEFEAVDLDASLDRALETLAPRIEEGGATIERVGRLPVVRGDAGQLERLFVNVVGNALKYRHPERAPIVRIESMRDGPRHWRIDVADNGIGFDNEHARRIFLMFQRLHGRDQYQGTGIGLSICSRIIERHGGEITADGRPGEGATFRMRIEGQA